MTAAATSTTNPHISATGYHWHLRAVDERAALAIAQQQNVPEIVGRILTARGIPPEDAADFLNPTLRNLLPDPFHFLDMEKAAARVARAVQQRETIAVFGDYDVDGATSTALLVRYFRQLGARAIPYIPDRMKEGYGPNAPALLKLHAQGARVAITVDCGTLAFEPIAAATAAGLDMIVLDHHQGEAQLPNALAIVNPNRLDETSPYRYLAAVGMAFMFAVAVNKLLRGAGYFSGHTEPNLLHLLDLVALGTVADVVPLTGLNRALVMQGLKIMAARNNLGLATLMDVAALRETPTAYTLGFVLGPRINAGGRVGGADFGARLLSTEDAGEALELAQALDKFNAERKAIESLVLEQAMEMAESQAADHPLLLVAGNGWHAGVIGIVAGRLKERFHKPVSVVAVERGIGKSSLRSVAGVDIGAAVIAAKQVGLLMAGGGHAMAAGFTVREEKLPALHRFLNERITKSTLEPETVRTLWLDGVVHLSGVTPLLAKMIAQGGPYGSAHPTPVLAVERVRIIRADVVGENHVRVIAVDANNTGRAASEKLTGIAFRCADAPLGHLLLNHRGSLDLAGEINLNRWQGTETAQMVIADARLN